MTFHTNLYKSLHLSQVLFPHLISVSSVIVTLWSRVYPLPCLCTELSITRFLWQQGKSYLLISWAALGFEGVMYLWPDLRKAKALGAAACFGKGPCFEQQWTLAWVYNELVRDTGSFLSSTNLWAPKPTGAPGYFHLINNTKQLWLQSGQPDNTAWERKSMSGRALWWTTGGMPY